MTLLTEPALTPTGVSELGDRDVDRGLTGALAVLDGGWSTGGADLWCTYAAVRTRRWLGADMPARDSDLAVLAGCRNTDGGYAWQRGLASDAWATYYCSSVNADAGAAVPDAPSMRSFVMGLAGPDGGFGMHPGRPSDVWATYYASRILTDVLGDHTDPGPHGGWLSALQLPSGGLTWAPGATDADVRACYYGVFARGRLAASVTWNVDELTTWLQSSQHRDGGFGFTPTSSSCMWATFRACQALAELGAGPLRPDACEAWIHANRRPSGFVRWPDYPVSDVWANFCAIGALQALRAAVDDSTRRTTLDALDRFALDAGGYTYREPAWAGDALATSAELLVAAVQASHDGTDRDAAAVRSGAAWLQRAHQPSEDGIMYMPGRGAETRCTLWGLAALDAHGLQIAEPARVGRWLRALQNPDGGFGYWEGRGSDLVSTVACTEIAARVADATGAPSFDIEGVRDFTCRAQTGDAMDSALVAQIFGRLGDREAARERVEQATAGRHRLGGYGRRPGAIPDLLTTYQVVRAQALTGSAVDGRTVDSFLRRTRRTATTYAWSPLTAGDGGPLASALGCTLQWWREVDEATLPGLVL